MPIACDADSPLHSDEQLVFLGASNDDFFSWAIGGHSIWSIWSGGAKIARGLYYLRRPSSARLHEFMNNTAAASFAKIDDQLRSIREIAACAGDRHARFWYAHDFTILDFATPRSPERLRMLEMRRDVVHQSGGRFLDLLESVRNEAGIAWFNDIIHLSSVGHRHVASLICDAIQRR